MKAKLFIYLRSGGIKEVIKYGLTYLSKYLYYKSETIFMYSDISNLKKIDISPFFSFVIVDDEIKLEALAFDRIRTQNCEKWFNKGSSAIIGLYKSYPVSFTWSHFYSHEIEGIGNIDLQKDKCWIGPTFVDKTVRGKGLNKQQILYQLMNLPQDVKYCITSANASNVASINSFKSLGFEKCLIFTKYYGAFSSKKTIYEFINNGESIVKLK